MFFNISKVETLTAFYFSNNLYHREIVTIDSSRNIQKNACGQNNTTFGKVNKETFLIKTLLMNSSSAKFEKTIN